MERQTKIPLNISPNQPAQTKRPAGLFVFFCLIGILSLALFLRVFHIEQVPTGIYPDEAVNATDALHALETGKPKWFYENNQGREGLFINLQALAFLWFGATVFALKFWSVIFGTFTVLGIYLLAMELWRNPKIAFVSAYLTAVSFWAINFSRIGFRAIMVPFLLSFSFFFLLRGLRTKKWHNFAFSGFIFALGLHTYIAFRVAPLILIAFCVGLLLSYENFLKIYWKHALVFLLFAVIAAAPMLWDFSQHPEHFNSRASHISIFSPEINHGDFWGTLSKTVGLSLIKYNFVGDQNWRHNYPPYSILDPLSGIAFLAGFLFLLPRTIFLLKRRFFNRDRNKELAINFLLLSWLFTMLMPEFLTDEGLPHALRSIGTIPVVFLIASMPFLWIGERLKTFGESAKVALVSILAFGLASIGVFNGVKYLVFFAENPKQHAAFNRNYSNMADFLLALPASEKKYVFTDSGGILPENKLPIAAQPIAFLTYKKNINLSYILPDQNDSTEQSKVFGFEIQTPSVVVLMNENKNFIEDVLNRFPQTTVETVDLYPGDGSDFRVLHVNR